jgi:hypothetical protein
MTGTLCGCFAILIIPAEERSGSATQAGVPEFIDDWLDFRKQEDGNDDLTAHILGGLVWLDRESSRLFHKAFADAAPDRQKEILDRIAWPERASAEDRRWAAFFSRFRDLTLNGFYSSKMGIADLPYLGEHCRAGMEGLRPGRMGEDRRADEEWISGIGRGSQALEIAMADQVAHALACRCRLQPTVRRTEVRRSTLKRAPHAYATTH